MGSQLDMIQGDGSEPGGEIVEAGMAKGREGIVIQATATDFVPGEVRFVGKKHTRAIDGQLPCDDRSRRARPDNDDIPVHGGVGHSDFLHVISQRQGKRLTTVASCRPIDRVIVMISAGVNAAFTDTGPSKCTTGERDSKRLAIQTSP